MTDHLRIETPGEVARVILANPRKHNAFDEHLIAGLTEAFSRLGTDTAIRVIRLEAEGPSFSAGADLDWMRRAGAAGHAENLEDARRLARLMEVIDTCAKPTLALVQGQAFGGGIGLIACCDIAIASETAKFAFSEVKLGLIPSAISPYVVRAIGPRQARRYFQTAEVFGADTALAIGLVHEVMPADALTSCADRITGALLKAAPYACGEAKRLVDDVAFRNIDARLMDITAQRIADIRSGSEAKEGLDAFLGRRQPAWIDGGLDK